MRRPRPTARRALIQRQEPSQGPPVGRRVGIEMGDRVCQGRPRRGYRPASEVGKLGDLVGE